MILMINFLQSKLSHNAAVYLLRLSCPQPGFIHGFMSVRQIQQVLKLSRMTFHFYWHLQSRLGSRTLTVSL